MSLYERQDDREQSKLDDVRMSRDVDRLLSLDEAVSLGLRNSRQLRITAEGVNRARGRVNENLAGYLPSLSSDVTFTRLDEGTTITEDVREIDWSGGNLPDGFYDEFVFVASLPDQPGAVLHFPVIQECAKGTVRWIDIPAAGQTEDDVKAPAPALTLGPKRAGGD